MSGKVKLYDLRERNYPHKRGDRFRSLQVFECWVCGALSNEVVMGGWPGYGVRVICPSACECWHHELENRVKSLNELFDKNIAELRIPFLREIKDDYIFNEENAAEVYMPKDGTGDIRTKIPNRCNVCGALTNKAVIKIKLGKEVMSPLCPQFDKAWHCRIAKEFHALAGKLEEMIDDARKSVRKKIKNDLMGSPGFSLKRTMTNVCGWKRGKICPHYK